MNNNCTRLHYVSFNAGNLIAGADIWTDDVFSANIEPALVKLIDSEDAGIRKEVCWILSNVTANMTSHIDDVMHSDLFPKVVHLLQDPDACVQKEAVWTV